MIKTINGVNYFYRWLNSYQKERPTVVCLHGFTGTSATFLPVFSSNRQFNFLAIDLLGHGQSSVYVHPYRYRMELMIADLEELMQQLGVARYYLLGYSMGGRVALAWSLTYPQGKLGLLLESASPGLKTEAERENRRQNDGKLAARLVNSGVTAFVDFWQELPLFASQKKLPETIQAQVRNERLQQRAFGLATSLFFMGTGAQQSYWSALEKNRFPVLFIAGQLDQKFLQIGLQMAEITSNFIFEVVQGAGHCVHLEKPAVFEKIVLDFLKKSKGADYADTKD